jgi:hypothetical protein
MNRIARSVEETKELINEMLKGGAFINGEWFEENCGDAYLCWDANVYEPNVSCRYFAEEAAREYQRMGYFVYYQPMGRGNNRIPEGTYTTIRIKTKPKHYNSSLIEFY